MKKLLIIMVFSFLFIVGVNAAEEDRTSGEKYFAKAVKYYLEGNLDSAVSVLTRALQKDTNNSKYEALYDIILDEKENLKVIKLGRPDAPGYLTDDQFGDLKKYIDKVENSYEGKSREMKRKVEKLVNIISKENEKLDLAQTEIIEKKLPVFEKQISLLQTKSGDNFLWILILIILILAFILTSIFVIMTYSARIKKLKQSFKYLKVRQDEQYRKLIQIEETQKRLDSSNYNSNQNRP